MNISGELLPSDLPPIEDLQISVPEAECFQVGTVSSCVDDLVVVQSLPGMPVLDLVRFIDRVTYFSYFTKSPLSLILLQIFQLLLFFQHPVNILVTDFTNPDSLTNDLFILKLIMTLPLRRALKQWCKINHRCWPQKCPP